MELVASLPSSLAPLKQFLQRAVEFQAKQPLVSYYLKLYVCHQGMKLRRKEDKEASAFLRTLMEVLESDKAKLTDLEGADGRTVLTKAAFQLFTKADDKERCGEASELLVKLFFTASILFEATKQYTDDGQMDPIATEKCKYARYIAIRMKKALDSGKPYVSPNKVEQPVEGGDEAPAAGDDFNAPPPPHAPVAQQPKKSASSSLQAPTTFIPDPSVPFPGVAHNLQQQQQPPQPPPSSVPQQQKQQPSNNNNNNLMNFSVPQHAPQLKQSPQPPQPTAIPPPSPQQQQYTDPSLLRPYSTSTAADAPSMDQMLEAQKFAKQAVSALQFYDYATAKTMLLKALGTLEK